ncbi:type II toxin-antitoxin system RelE/ParE family toxin [uncultured Desulfobacter sp.]|uniref:type II toxin-antitoxin system RelE/ParE family toxin n=1 Tax=uncultured Desulfobacter sp. TaxID=240139 RepID=UPI002AAC4D1B|nr:type II toxin-antitoxin system RelE/ParE family toxin [uncultured Desulfobacter sp.]
MTEKWKILFCDGMEDACPVTDFINSCPEKHQVKLLRLLGLLEEHGPTLPRPYADVLHDGVHELRFTLSQDRIRVLYFFCYRKFIVLYEVFFKNTRKVPEKYINQVIAYRNEFLSRISEKKLEKISRAVF